MAGPARARYSDPRTQGNRLQSHRHGGAPGHQPAPDPLPDCTPEHRCAQRPGFSRRDRLRWPVCNPYGKGMASRRGAPTVAQLRPPAPGALQVVDLVVVHSISLPPGQYGTGAVQQLFTNALDWDAHPYYQQIKGLQVSAHFFIERNGRLWQFVDCDQRAWHAGQSFIAAGPTATTTPSALSWKAWRVSHSSPPNTKPLGSCVAI